MSLTKTISVGGLDVTARELTVTEIRAWYAKLTDPQEAVDVVDVLLFRDLSVADICTMSDLTPEALASLAPSDIDKVIAAIKEVNPRFSKCGHASPNWVARHSSKAASRRPVRARCLCPDPARSPERLELSLGGLSRRLGGNRAVHQEVTRAVPAPRPGTGS